MLHVKSPDLRGKPKRVHQSKDDGVTAVCGLQVGRSWKVTADAVDCKRCLGETAGWRKTRSRIIPGRII